MTSDRPTSDARTGALSAVGAYLLWGFFPLFLIQLREVGASQVLAHRILWAVPIGVLIISLRRQWPQVLAAVTNRKVLLTLSLSSCLIGTNWLVFIQAANNEQIFQTSLGYYISPLMSVLIGIVVLKERLNGAQYLAVGLAALGVSILAFYGGEVPVTALILATSFATYGYLRKVAEVGAMPGLFVETLIMAPVAAGWLFLFLPPAARVWGVDGGLSALLFASGPLTVAPLLLFAIATRRMRLSTLSFIQFLAPTLQFCVGLWDGEAFTRAHQLCFGFIWLAASVFVFDAVRKSRGSSLATAGGVRRGT